MGRPRGSKNKPKVNFDFDGGEFLREHRKREKQLTLPSPDKKSKSSKSGKKDKYKDKFKKAKDINELTVVFGKESKKIRQFIEGKEDDTASLMAQRQLLSMLIDLIPVAESTYRKDSRQSNAYAMTSLISQIRELIHDIQSTQDRGRVADSIVYNILQPMILSFAQFVVDNNHHTKRDLKEIVDARSQRELDSVMNKQAKALGAYMQSFFEDLKARITKELSE